MSNEYKMKRITKQQWQSLKFDEKILILEEIKEEECDNLGIYYPITLEYQTLDYPTVGLYNHGELTITIDDNFVITHSAKEVIEILCHEVYHAYQYCLVEAFNKLDEFEQNLLFFDYIRFYKEEIENYDLSSNKYPIFLLEIKAREYSEKQTSYYVKEGGEHNGEI